MIVLALTAVLLFFLSNHPVAARDNPPTSDNDEEQDLADLLPGAFPVPRSCTPTPSPSSPTTPPSVQTATATATAAPPTPPDQSPPLQHQQRFTPPLRVDIAALPATFTALPSQPHASSPPRTTTDTPAFEFHDPMQSSTHQGNDAGQDPPTYDGLIGDVDGDNMYFDDDSLGTLEKIYLFARSKAIFHRVFISRSLPNFLPDVTPHEAVEYVLPLLNSLGTDPEESVREAFVSELVPAMWWFYSHCQLVDDGYFALAGSTHGSHEHADEEGPPSREQYPAEHHRRGERSPDRGPLHFAQNQDQSVVRSEASASGAPTATVASASHGSVGQRDNDTRLLDVVESPVDVTNDNNAETPHSHLDTQQPLLPVQVFTPLLGSILLSTNPVISDGGRAAVVELLRRLKDGYGLSPNVPGPGGLSAPPTIPPEAGSLDKVLFGPEEREMLERELLIGVVIGMARMDSDAAQGEFGVGLSSIGGDDSSGSSAEVGLGLGDVVGGRMARGIEAVAAEEARRHGTEDERRNAQDWMDHRGSLEQSSYHHQQQPHHHAPQEDVVLEDAPLPVLISVSEPPRMEEVHPPGVAPPVWTEVGEVKAVREHAEATYGVGHSPVDGPIPLALESVEAEAEAEAEAQAEGSSALRDVPGTPASPTPFAATVATPPALSLTSSPAVPLLHLPPTSPTVPTAILPSPSPSSATLTPTPETANLPIPYTARLTYLTPSSSRSHSPLGLTTPSVPHTPPSPTLRPVRLPSSDSVGNVSIPGTPYEMTADREVEMLGLDVESEPEPETGGAPPPPSEHVAPETTAAPMPIQETPMTSQLLEAGFSFVPIYEESRPLDEAMMRRPILSPMQPATPTPPSATTSVQDPISLPTRSQSYSSDKAESAQSVPRRTQSYSSDKSAESTKSESTSTKSESTPTEGSSGDTVTPSEAPVVEPAKREPSGMVETESAEEQSLSLGPSVPPSMSFRSVPIEAPLPSPSLQKNVTSPSSSTATSTSTPSTQPLDSTPQSALLGRTSSSATSTISLPSSSHTFSSTGESEVVRTPESPRDENVIIHLPGVPDEGEDGLTGPPSDSKNSELEGVEPDVNPYFLSASVEGLFRPDYSRKASSEATGSGNGTGTKRRDESGTPPLTLRKASTGGSAGMTRLAPLTEIPDQPQQEQEMHEDLVPAEPRNEDLPSSGSGLVPASSFLTDVAQHALPPPSSEPADAPLPPFPRSPMESCISRTCSHPGTVPLPASQQIDSPYPSPPTHDLFSAGPNMGDILSSELSSLQAEETSTDVDPWRSQQYPTREDDPLPTERPVVRLPGSPPSDEQPALEPDPASDLNISRQSSNSETSWFHNSGDMVEGSSSEVENDAAIGRVASMSLVAAVTAAGVLGEETKQVFTDEVVRVGKDHLYWVRREAAYALGALAKVVIFDLLTSSLLPLYEEMTSDADWHVRQSAIFALPGIISRLPAGQRRSLALAQSEALSYDAERAVRSALLEVMGEMIYCFRDDDGGPPTELVDIFVGKNEHYEDTWAPTPEPVHQWGLKTPFRGGQSPISSSGSSSPPLRSMFEEYNDPSSSQFQGLFGTQHMVPALAPSRDPERVLICAFNFPAVVASMGPRRWQELQPYYLILTQDPSPKVRRSLGASIGEIARIIGADHAHTDLVPIWTGMIRDDDNEVRAKVVGCLDTFVRALGLEDRRSLGIQLESIWTSHLPGWREREALAAQLGTLTEPLVSAGRAGSVRVLMLSALTDPVAAVREAAIASCAQYMVGLAGLPDVLETARMDLKSLAVDASYRKRVTYVAVSQAVLLNQDYREELQGSVYQKTLDSLSQDPVADVRIGLSRLIGALCAHYYPDHQLRPSWIQSIVRRLSRDESVQVKSFVAFLARRPSSLTTSIVSTSPDSSSSRRSTFATFSRPPNNASLLTDTLDHLGNIDDLDLNTDPQDAINASPALFSTGTAPPSTHQQPVLSGPVPVNDPSADNAFSTDSHM